MGNVGQQLTDSEVVSFDLIGIRCDVDRFSCLFTSKTTLEGGSQHQQGERKRYTFGHDCP